jgi:hypothetical protein
MAKFKVYLPRTSSAASDETVTIEADTFDIQGGGLLVLSRGGDDVGAFAMGCWKSVERLDPSEDEPAKTW